MYTPQDYLLFLLAIVLILGGLPLLGTLVEWRENRKAKRREYQLHNLNRREDIRRRCDSYLDQTQKVLAGIEGRRSA